MNNNNTTNMQAFDEFFSEAIAVIDDRAFTSIMDMGIDPGIAFEAVYINPPAGFNNDIFEINDEDLFAENQ